MALYHNLSCSKSNLGRRAENSFLWALSHPSLLFLHTLLSHPFKHLCSGCTKKRRAKNCSCRWRLPYATLGALPVSPGAGTARLPPRHGDGSSLQGQHRVRSPQQLHAAAGLPGQPRWLRLLQPRNRCCSTLGSTSGVAFFAEENFDL